MDGERFDSLTQWLVRGVSRRAVTAALAAAVATAGLADAEAGQHHRRRQRRQQRRRRQRGNVGGGEQCQALHEACTADTNPCCPSLTCQYALNCDQTPQTTCCANEGTPCGSVCDCCNGLRCNEQQNNICDHCGFPGEECLVANDCCIAGYTCGENSCQNVNRCCGVAGAPCFENCNCCKGFTCDTAQQRCVEG
jgi:hypothetical protein